MYGVVYYDEQEVYLVKDKDKIYIKGFEVEIEVVNDLVYDFVIEIEMVNVEQVDVDLYHMEMDDS